MKTTRSLITTIAVLVIVLSAAFGQSISVPPGYTFYRGLVWSSKVYNAGIAQAKKQGVEAVCVTQHTSGDLYLIREGYRISKVDKKTKFEDGTMLAGAYNKPIEIEGITLNEGEYAIRKAGKFVKSEQRLGKIQNAPKASTAAKLKKISADVKAEPDAALVKKGRAKAKKLGYNPVPVFMNKTNSITIVQGTSFSIRNGSWSLVKGDMLINVGPRPVKAGKHTLQQGEYATVDKDGINKGDTNIADLAPKQIVKQATPPARKDAPNKSDTNAADLAPKKIVKQAALPTYKDDLNGSNPVRVRNPNNFSVLAGLRSANKGKNFTVGAKGVRTVYVPNGKYDIYFVYSNEPDALYKGNEFSLKNNGVEIQIVKVVGGNYSIQKVK